MVQLYTRVIDEFLVNSSTQGQHGSPSIAALPDGGFLIAWADSGGQGGDAGGYAIKAQKVDASGNKVGGEVLINTATLGDQLGPQVEVLPSGRILVTWTDHSGQGGDAAGFGVKGQLLAADF